MEDEELEEILGRLDIPLEAQEDQETLRDYLRETLNPTSDKQIAAFDHIVERVWEGIGRTANMELIGIRRITIEYPWGIEVRYGVQGLPGLWGWARVRQIIEAER